MRLRVIQKDSQEMVLGVVVVCRLEVVREKEVSNFVNGVKEIALSRIGFCIR